MARITSTIEIEVGRLGRLSFEPGVWAYVGSAFGPGGLAARLGRHLIGSRRTHWHIDHLLVTGEVIGVLVSAHDSRLECEWAGWTAARTVRSVGGFGSSDCRCPSHLFLVGGEDELEQMVRDAARDLRASFVTASQLRSATRHAGRVRSRRSHSK
jgi:Uri superfamily endonuclease